MGKNDGTVYKFDLFKHHADIAHGVFTRSYKTNTRSCDPLNIGMNSSYERSGIENPQEFINPLIFLNQVHGTKIKVLRKSDNDLSQIFQQDRKFYTADAVITDMNNISLVIHVADCQAVLLYDHKNKVIANIHSGWRGSVKNIIGDCVDKMICEFVCNPENIIAGISPSLGPCCSEFINYKKEFPGNIWAYELKKKNYFDFWKLSCDQLMDKGIKKENIENMKICTRCNMNEFYSFRGEKTNARFACVISMI